MHRRTIFLIVFLGIVTGGLLLLALVSLQQNQGPAVEPSPSVTEFLSPSPVVATGRIFFYPETVSSSSSASTVEVWVDAGANLVSGIQLEMKYDPTFLANMKLTPEKKGGFMGEEKETFTLYNIIDQKSGRITYVIGITPDTKPRSGNGKVATLSFTKRGSTTTSIQFLPSTKFSQIGTNKSVLKEAKDLIIK